MPEAKIAFPYSNSPEPQKKSAAIKMSCGIGDTDGFPAFDLESDAYATKDDSSWGFLITGGAEFHMPLTVFQVTPDGLADKGGIRLGDIILEINEEDATQLTLSQAHEKLNAKGKKIFFLIKSMDDEEQLEGYGPGEERTVLLRIPKPMPPPKATIEERLREMQRKLSEIAEIPKILSSTLATVSQTFDKLMPTDAEQLKQLLARRGAQQRKFSYDEDAIDYELSDNESEDEEEDDEDEEDECVSKLGDNIAEQQVKRAKVKEITPESDYASEVHDLENIEDEDDDDDDEVCELSEEDDDVNDDDDDVDGDVDVNTERNNNDFFSTSYTWNLRNVPKLSVNDELEEKLEDEAEDNYQLQKKPRRSLTQETAPKQEKQEKLDKLERCWPWADREKIIYKQSTCHLVPRKPLGIVEQRIQLLAKQNLVDNLKQMEQQQQQHELEKK